MEMLLSWPPPYSHSCIISPCIFCYSDDFVAYASFSSAGVVKSLTYPYGQRVTHLSGNLLLPLPLLLSLLNLAWTCNHRSSYEPLRSHFWVEGSLPAFPLLSSSLAEEEAQKCMHELMQVLSACKTSTKSWGDNDSLEWLADNPRGMNSLPMLFLAEIKVCGNGGPYHHLCQLCSVWKWNMVFPKFWLCAHSLGSESDFPCIITNHKSSISQTLPLAPPLQHCTAYTLGYESLPLAWKLAHQPFVRASFSSKPRKAPPQILFMVPQRAAVPRLPLASMDGTVADAAAWH